MSTSVAAPLRQERAVSVLFVLSGMTGLSYEVIWFKQFSHVWGSSTLAMASVVGAFLLGLGIGSRLGGFFADRARRPVLWYGACEIGIGLFALAIPWEADLLWQFSIRCYAALRDMPAWYALIRCATTLIVIGPACVLMGGTLPLLVRQRAQFFGLGRATGWLYGINTIGAALGCYLIGFHLLPEWGLSGSNVATAGANLAIGAAAFVAGRRAPSVSPADPTPVSSPDPVPSQGAISLRSVCFISALTGFAALALQTVWNRQLALVLGSSTYAFSAMLLVVLTGIGLGSLLFHMSFVQRADRATVAVFVIGAVALSTIAGVWALPYLAHGAGIAMPWRAGYAMNALVCIGGSALIEFVPAVAMGALFPLLVSLTQQSASHAGLVVGRIYAWNTVGALAGTVAASILIIPSWGTEATVAAALFVYLAAALKLTIRAGDRLLSFATVSMIGASLLIFHLNPQDPRRTNFGSYLYGDTRVEQNLSEVLFFREGAISSVLVSQQGDDVALRVNGKVDGGSHGDMAMQLGLAYFPRFLNSDARNVLVIGFGTGTTSGASLLFPETRVTCCEIEPAVIAAEPHFVEVNHRPLDSPHFTIVYDDARAYVQGTDESFDLILSEPSNPWIAGVANLFTREFYELASRKLAPRGILAQWVQSYAFAPADYALIVRTLGDVFPHQRLVRISEVDTILIASNEPLEHDPADLRAAQRLVDGSSDIKADLTQFYQTSDVAALFLSRIVLDEQGFRTLGAADGSDERNLDRDCQLEFRAARHLFAMRDKTISQFILSAARSEWFLEHYRHLGCDGRHADALHTVIEVLIASGAVDKALPLLEFGLRESPDSPALLADQLMLQKPFDFAAFERLLAIPDRSVVEHANRIGVYLTTTKEYDTAVKILSRLCERFPRSATAWTNLAANYTAQGKREQAEQAERRAGELDPARYFDHPRIMQRQSR